MQKVLNDCTAQPLWTLCCKQRERKRSITSPISTGIFSFIKRNQHSYMQVDFKNHLNTKPSQCRKTFVRSRERRKNYPKIVRIELDIRIGGERKSGIENMKMKLKIRHKPCTRYWAKHLWSVHIIFLKGRKCDKKSPRHRMATTRIAS